MALRQFLSFDGFPSTGGTTTAVGNLTQFFPGASGYDPANNGLAIGPTVFPTGATVTSGWIRGNWYGYAIGQNGAGGCSAFGFPMSSLSDVTTRASYFGFRYCRSSNSFGDGVVLLNSAGVAQTVVPAASPAANQIAFIEFLIDRTNKLLTVWIDGVQLSSSFFDYNAFAAGADTRLFFGTPYNYGYPGGITGNWWMRDLYSLDDTQDSTQCSRLGPVDIRPAALASVSAPNWVSSDSQPALTDLSTVFTTTAASWTAPTQTEPPTMDPLQFVLSNANLVPGEKILGVKTDISALRPGGYIYSPQITVGFNDQTVNGKKMSYPSPNAMLFNQNAFLLEKAPDGTAWTPQSVGSAVTTLTP